MYPIAKTVRLNLERKLFLNKNKLIIDDKTVTIDSLDELPFELQPKTLFEKRMMKCFDGSTSRLDLFSSKCIKQNV